ncbi:MAG: CHASE4 domain-containing protein, partial [Cyanobium sp.]
MRRPFRLLRSWWKEEHRVPLERRSVLRTATLAALVFIPLVALQLLRRSEAVLHQQRASLDDTLAIMEVSLANTTRIAGDWGHWDDTYRFLQGTNPQFVDQGLESTVLFD